MDQRRLRWKQQFERETYLTRVGRNGRQTTLSERSKRRSRPRSEVAVAEKGRKNEMGQRESAELIAHDGIVSGDGKNGTRANSIHLSLQGKGGVGKSLVASILAQYFRARGLAVRCIDT